MTSIHTVLNACLYTLILILLLAFATVGCFLYRKYAKDAVKLADVEANPKGKEQKPRLRVLILPASLDSVVHPSAARRRSSQWLPSSERVIPNPFRARFRNESPAVVDNTTSRKADQPKMDDGDNHDTSDHDQISNAPVCIPIPPRRPLRPTLLDDLLAGFPYEHDVAREMWFPLANPGTAHLELGIVSGTRPASRYVQRNGSDSHPDVILALKQGRPEKDERSVFSIDEDEVDHSPLTPSNTIVEVVTKKSKKRDERRRKKKKNGQPRVHVFEIPELYVNARPYEEIEAEEQARAAAVALAAKEAEVEEATVETTIEVAADEEEEVLVAAAHTREGCQCLELPEQFCLLYSPFPLFAPGRRFRQLTARQQRAVRHVRETRRIKGVYASQISRAVRHVRETRRIKGVYASQISTRRVYRFPLLAQRSAHAPFQPYPDLARGAIHMLRSALTYLFMLAVMTFQLGFIILVLA